MIIAIPSKGRANDFLTSKWFDDYIVFCPEKEKKDYLKKHKNVVGIPDKQKGITKARNFILDYAKEKGEKWVLMVDDDITFINYFENNKYNKITDKKEILWLVENNFIMTEELGTNVWGFSIGGAQYSYSSNHPFAFLALPLGSFMGIIEDGQRFDERFTTKEDYDFSIQSMKKHRKTFVDKKHSYKAKHWEQEGGCSAYRTIALEVEMQQLLIKKWGSKIVKKNHNKAGGGGNSNDRYWEVSISIPIKGI
jgi:hypothetical protein